MSEKSNQICKIIYFDEESVADYIQILAGGTVVKETKQIDEDTEATTTKGKAKASVIGRLVSLISIKAELEGEANEELISGSKDITKNVVTNTILTDFIDLIEDIDDDSISKAVKCFIGYKLIAPKDSFSQILLVTPYLSMIKGGATIPAGDISIAMEKMDNAIRSAKGYYEFVGKKKDESDIIFRFNIKAFRNNYRIADLLKMDVCIYAIKVGKSSIEQLNVSKEFDIPLVVKNNPDYIEEDEEEPDQSSENKQIDVYDALLVGVGYND